MVMFYAVSCSLCKSDFVIRKRLPIKCVTLAGALSKFSESYASGCRVMFVAPPPTPSEVVNSLIRDEGAGAGQNCLRFCFWNPPRPVQPLHRYRPPQAFQRPLIIRASGHSSARVAVGLYHSIATPPLACTLHVCV